MAVESASYINQLDPTNPNGSSLKSEGDNQIRLLKTVLQTTFPNVTGAVTPTQVEINRLVGVTGDIQTHIDRSLRQSGGSAISALPDAATRANKVLSFDGSGNPRTTIAETDLSAAVTAASTATTQAGIATTQAGIATTQAGIATTKAAEAAASAASIAGGPVVSVNGMTGIVTGIATTAGVETLTNKTIGSGTVFSSGALAQIQAAALCF